MIPQNKTIVATDFKHLSILIALNIKDHGLNCDLNHIDVSQVNDLSLIFFRSNFNGDISKWDVSNVEYMEQTFYGSKFNGDISKWNTVKLKSIHATFERSQFQGDLSQWTCNPKEVRHFVDYNFKGKLPQQLNHRLYEICLSKSSLDILLKEHPFGLSHIKRILDLKTKPSYIKKELFFEIKNHQKICEGLGMSKNQIAQFLHQNNFLQNDGAQSVLSLEL